MNRLLKFACIAAVVLAGATGLVVYQRYLRDERPQPISDSLEHFKYGSIGAEVNGFPYAVWRVLPALMPDKLPEGWAGFGFLTEPGHDLPVGISVRRYQVDRVGFNCATCHTNRIGPDGPLLLGAPAERLDLQRYQRFLIALPDDPRFEADTLLPAMRAADPGFDWLDGLVYRHYIIPKLREEFTAMRASNAWMDSRPPHGPGRTDAGNPWRQRFGIRPGDDEISGATDFPHLWAQKSRVGKWAHWDGNNSSLDERNLSAALAGGATPASLDHASIERVAAWSLEAPPPPFPGPIDQAAAARGGASFVTEGCAACHDPAGAEFAEVTDVAMVGTDRDRYDVFSAQLLSNFARVGEGYPWRFTQYRKSAGYVNMPLDGIWARAPYLHNGAVPTLDDLLRPPVERPVEFLRGCANFDTDRIGFDCARGVPFDTRLRGNSNGGHLWGTGLSADARRDMIEYLKGL